MRLVVDPEWEQLYIELTDVEDLKLRTVDASPLGQSRDADGAYLLRTSHKLAVSATAYPYHEWYSRRAELPDLSIYGIEVKVVKTIEIR